MDEPILLRRAGDGKEDCPVGGCKAMEVLEWRFNLNHERMDRIEAKLDQNCADTTEVLDILRLGKSFFRLAGYFGAVVKWVLGIATAVLIFWVALRGIPPK